MNKQTIQAPAPGMQLNDMQRAELAAFKSGQLSEEAQAHLRTYAKFYLWAIPLFDMGQIRILHRTIEFSAMVAKRFLIGKGANDVPTLEVQPPEARWLEYMPFAYVGVNFKAGFMILVARPAKPLSASGIAIPIDLKEKLECFKNQPFMRITASPLMGGQPRLLMELEIKELDGGFATKKKQKHKM